VTRPGWWGVLLLWVLGIAWATPADLAATTVQQTAAQAQALRVPADNYLRDCVTALAQAELDSTSGLGADWDGAPCSDPRLHLPDANARQPTILSSVIQLRPGTAAGYEVRVTGVGGTAVRWPTLAAVQAEQAQAQQARLWRALSWLIWLPLGAALMWLSVYVLPGWPVLAGFGIFGAGYILFIVVFLTAAKFYSGPHRFDGMFEGPGLYVLAAGLTFGVPRSVARWGQEAWWVSLGTGWVAAYLNSWIVGLPLTLAERVGLDVTASSSLYWSLLLASVLFTLWGLWQRL
jgi:hypothetical protein